MPWSHWPIFSKSPVNDCDFGEIWTRGEGLKRARSFAEPGMHQVVQVGNVGDEKYRSSDTQESLVASG